MFTYVTSCVDGGRSHGHRITKMMDNAKDIEFDEFAEQVDIEQIEEEFGYGNGGLKLKDDWHISYHSSRWNGKPCLIMCHSSIEYIYQEQP